MRSGWALATALALLGACAGGSVPEEGASSGAGSGSAARAVSPVAGGTSSPAPAGASSASSSTAARSEVERGPVRLIVEAEPRTLRLSDELSLTITIDAESGVKVVPPPFGERLGAFVIRDFHEPLPEVSAGREQRVQRYRLEPTGAGQWTIPPIPVSFTDARPGGDGEDHVVESEPLVVEVTTSIEGGAPSLADVRPAAPPLPPPAGILPSRWVWGIGGGLALAALALVLLLRRLRRERAVPPPTPRELAARELRDLLASNPLGHGQMKTFYVELTGIVRRFIERTTGIRAPEQTTDEFLREMKRNDAFGGGEREKLAAFLEAADLVKFANHRPGPGEADASLERARAFVGLAGGAPRGAKEAA